jgi:O-antigen/teichoic acid export membrane protein
MRIDSRDVRRFGLAAVGLYVAVGLVALVSPDTGAGLAVVLTTLLAAFVLLVLFLRAWHWFVSEAFSLIEERAREQREREPGRDRR